MDDIETINFNTHPSSTATKMRNLGYFGNLRSSSALHKSQYNKVVDMDVSSGKAVFNPVAVDGEEAIELSDIQDIGSSGSSGSAAAAASIGKLRAKVDYMSINEPALRGGDVKIGISSGVAVSNILHNSTNVAVPAAESTGMIDHGGRSEVVVHSRAEDEQEMIRVTLIALF